MPAAAMTRALAIASVCDAVLAVGSTLSVFPAAQVPLTAVDAGAPLVIVNSGETEFDRLASALVDEPAGPTLDRLADLLA